MGHKRFNKYVFAALLAPMLSHFSMGHAQGSKGLSIQVRGDIEVANHGGDMRVVELDVFRNAFITANANGLILYEKSGQRKIPFGQKIKEQDRSYTLNQKGNTLVFRGKMTGKSFNFGYTVKLTIEDDWCKLSKSIRFGDPDISHRFDGYFRRGYDCKISRGNVFN